MKKDFLKGISAEGKRDFLSKLQSGKFTLGKVYDPVKSLNFDLQESGKYLCKETGKLMNRDEIESLQGFRMTIERVSNRDQVAGLKQPDGLVLVPYMEQEYLDSLLVSNEPDTFKDIKK